MMHIGVAVLVVASMTGCATPYVVDRGRDAADIFTATIGYGAGAKARVGPLSTGLFYNRDTVGLRGGALFKNKSGATDDFTSIIPIPVSYVGLMFVLDEFFPEDSKSQRHKGYQVISAMPLVSVVSSPTNDWFTILTYNSQIEVAAGIGGTLRLGFNPGELIDFILGWTTLDIYGDDLEARKQKRNRTKRQRTRLASLPILSDDRCAREGNGRRRLYVLDYQHG